MTRTQLVFLHIVLIYVNSLVSDVIGANEITARAKKAFESCPKHWEKYGKAKYRTK